MVNWKQKYYDLKYYKKYRWLRKVVFFLLGVFGFLAVIGVFSLLLALETGRNFWITYGSLLAWISLFFLVVTLIMVSGYFIIRAIFDD